MCVFWYLTACVSAAFPPGKFTDNIKRTYKIVFPPRFAVSTKLMSQSCVKPEQIKSRESYNSQCVDVINRRGARRLLWRSLIEMSLMYFIYATLKEDPFNKIALYVVNIEWWNYISGNHDTVTNFVTYRNRRFNAAIIKTLQYSAFWAEFHPNSHTDIWFFILNKIAILVPAFFVSIAILL